MLYYRRETKIFRVTTRIDFIVINVSYRGSIDFILQYLIKQVSLLI